MPGSPRTKGCLIACLFFVIERGGRDAAIVSGTKGPRSKKTEGGGSREEGRRSCLLLFFGRRRRKSARLKKGIAVFAVRLPRVLLAMQAPFEYSDTEIDVFSLPGYKEGQTAALQSGPSVALARIQPRDFVQARAATAVDLKTATTTTTSETLVVFAFCLLDIGSSSPPFDNPPPRANIHELCSPAV